MSLELFTNNATSTLASGITSGSSTLSITSAAPYPATGNFRITIDNEILLVTNVSGTTFSITRAQEGTSAASHSTSANVNLYLTAGALQQYRRDGNTGFDTDANRPAAGLAGRSYFASDAKHVMVDNGSSWQAYGPVFASTIPPALGSWTGVNTGAQNTSTAQKGAAVYIACTGSNGAQLSGLVKSQPSTPYTCTFGILGTKIWASDQAAYGVGFRNSSSGKIELLADVNNGNPSFNLVYDQLWTNATTASTVYGSYANNYFDRVNFFRLTNDGTNRKTWFSVDGETWYQVFTHAFNTDFTPDQIGVFIRNGDGSSGVAAALLFHYLET